MKVEKDETIGLKSTDDVVRVRQLVRACAIDAGFGLVDQTKIITAASEIARNAVDYGGGGTVKIEVLRNGAHNGVRLTVEDRGPGIADLALAMKDGYTGGSGLGLGLGGAKRLCSDFEIKSAPGQGTTVILARWR
jgi:serine/threonine-protein kinase RsbT